MTNESYEKHIMDQSAPRSAEQFSSAVSEINHQGPRPRSGSHGNIFNASEGIIGGFLRRRGSLTQLLVGINAAETGHNFLDQALNDSVDDFDTISLKSDSAFSEVSHATQKSCDVDAVTSELENLHMEKLASTGKTGMIRNLSADSLNSKNTHELNALREHAKQKRLSHSMVWNWVKSHQMPIDENSETLGVMTHKTDMRHKLAVTKRELNSLGPSNW